MLLVTTKNRHDDRKRQQRRHTNQPVLKRFQPPLFSLFLCLGEAAGVFDLCMSLFIKQ